MIPVLAITILGLVLLLVFSRQLELSYLVYFFCGGAIVASNYYIVNNVSRLLFEGAIILLYLAVQLFIFFWRNQSDNS